MPYARKEDDDDEKKLTTKKKKKIIKNYYFNSAPGFDLDFEELVTESRQVLDSIMFMSIDINYGYRGATITIIYVKKHKY